MDNLITYSLSDDPIISFNKWLEKAKKIEQNATAMSVATYDLKKNRPTSRFLLFKGISDGKIVFYTNYTSQKSHDLDHNPEVALNFYWHNSQQQIKIQGKATKMSVADSESYFQTRDRESQIASYCSSQSASIIDKEALMAKFNEVKEHFRDMPIPLPKNWGGYLVEPYEFEFFLYGENRLNDRFLYERNQLQQWIVQRLQP